MHVLLTGPTLSGFRVGPGIFYRESALPADVPHLNLGSYTPSVLALLAALELHDPDTHQHSLRVAQLALSMAEQSFGPYERQMSGERALCQKFYAGALLHDIGKIGIATEVLNAPRRLTPAEFAVIQTHPQLGAIALSRLGFDPIIVQAAQYHHERVDRRGYPFGLVGADIPLPARIVCICDAYDAMTHDRPYQQAMAHEQALDVIWTQAGSQFDHDIADRFRKLPRESFPA